MENNSSSRDNLTLDERFNMFELTADLKKLCPGVKREYFTYQPMTDDIYNKWERTQQALSFMELQHLDIDDNVSKSNEQANPTNGHDPNRMIKVPVSSFYSISPLLLRKDIAAIVTDNISTEGSAAAAAAAVTQPKDIAKCNDAPLLPVPIDIKASENYRKALSKKKASIMRTKRRLLSAYNCHLLDSDSLFDAGGQSQTPFYLRSKISTPGFWATNFLFDKEKAWNIYETQMVNSKSTKDFSD